VSDCETIELLAVDLRVADEKSRALLTLAGADVSDLLEVVGADRPVELVVLADADRLEFYAPATDGATTFGRALAWLLHRAGSVQSVAGAPVLKARGFDTARHLFRSAVGLDPGSTILERIAAMQSALTRASLAGTLGRSTSVLFERAVQAAWRAQGETALGQSPIIAEWELERPEAERIVEEELCSFRADQERAVPSRSTAPASLYPVREPASMLRLTAVSGGPRLGGKAVA